MKPGRIRVASAFLLLVFMSSLVPACSMDRTLENRQNSLDDAMLLMLASHSHMVEETSSAQSEGGGVLMVADSSHAKASGMPLNEVLTLMEQYRGYLDFMDRHPEEYDQERYQNVRQRLENNISGLSQRAEKLQNTRRRRGGLFRFVGRMLKGLMTTISRTTRFVVENVGPILVRNVITNVKQSIRQVFEGRIDAIIVRFATRFGPLSPLVQKKIKTMLDRWWIPFRDHLLGNDKKPVSPAVPAQSAPSIEKGNCALETAWINEYMTEFQDLLIKEGRNCNRPAITLYDNCLWNRAAEGMCQLDAIHACDSLYKSIPKNDDGGNITIQGETEYTAADLDEFQLIYPSQGGAVTGNLHVFEADWMNIGCSYDITAELKGSYSPETCTFSGNTTLITHYIGNCGVCAKGGPECDVTKNEDVQWSLLLDALTYRGDVGDISVYYPPLQKK